MICLLYFEIQAALGSAALEKAIQYNRPDEEVEWGTQVKSVPRFQLFLFFLYIVIHNLNRTTTNQSLARSIFNIKKHIAKVRTQQQQKQAWYNREIKNKRSSEERYKVKKQGMSHPDAFRLCSRVSSGGRTS